VTAPVALALLLAVALGCRRVGVPVLLLVVGVRIAPFLPAARHGIGVEGIGTNLVVMVFTAAATLASHLATNGLLRAIRGKLENLLAVTALAMTHRALRIRIESDHSVRNHRESFAALRVRADRSPRAGCDRAAKKSSHIETTVEFLYRLSASGTAVHQAGRTDVLFHRPRHAALAGHGGVALEVE